MVDLVDGKRDESLKSTQSNPTTPERIERTVAGATHDSGYLGQRSREPTSSGETIARERAQGRDPPNHYSQELYKNGATVHDEHTSGMAWSNYGPLLTSMARGGVATGPIQNMDQSVAHGVGYPATSNVIPNEGPQGACRSANGSLEPATGYQSFFEKRRLERDRLAKPPLADPSSARYIANEHPQRFHWPASIPLGPPVQYRGILERSGYNRYQSAYSLHGPQTRHLNIPNGVPEGMNPSVNNAVEFLMGYQPANPYSGPPPRMYNIPNVTPRVISSATNLVERPMAYQPADPPPEPPPRVLMIQHPMEHQPTYPLPGHSAIPRQIVNEGPQRIAAAAYLALESPMSPHRVANEHLQSMDHIANISSSRAVAAGTIPPPLPPSVEEAYKKKCIELKRRMQEVEESNDVFRVRKARLARGIRKMRLERAYLLEMLGKRMKKNGSSVDGFPQPYDEESDGSSEGPPTVSFPFSSPSRRSRLKSLTNALTLQPHEKPLRSKRSHRRLVSSPPPNFGHQHPRPIAPSQAHPTSAYEPPRDGFRESAFQHVPTTNGHAAMHYPPHPSTYPPNSAYQPEPQVMRPRPQPPQSAFFNFLEGYIKRHPEKYPHQTQDELLQVAQRAWEETDAEEYKHYYEDKYQRELRAYEEQIAELERREREGMMEVQGPPPPPTQAQQPREAPAGVGGFTSING